MRHTVDLFHIMLLEGNSDIFWISNIVLRVLMFFPTNKWKADFTHSQPMYTSKLSEERFAMIRSKLSNISFVILGKSCLEQHYTLL